MAQKSIPTVARRRPRWLVFGCFGTSLIFIFGLIFAGIMFATLITRARAASCGAEQLVQGVTAVGSLQKAGVKDANAMILMTAVAGAASGFDASKVVGINVGLWQLGPLQWPVGGTATTMADPAANAAAAVTVAGGPGITDLTYWKANAAVQAFIAAGGTLNPVSNLAIVKTTEDAAGDFAAAAAAVAQLSGTAPGGCCGGGGAAGAPAGSGSGPLNAIQTTYARDVIGVAKGRNIPVFGQIIAIAVTLQESSLLNYANSKIPETMALPHDAVGSDGYSAGIFQQQTGPFGTFWGTPAQVMNPVYAAKRFYDEMLKVSNWQNLPLTVVAQTVQASAFPDAYAKWQGEATEIVNANQDVAPIATDGDTFNGVGCGGVDGCVNPIMPADWGLARTDQGVDYLPNRADTPVVAICDGVVTYSETNIGWPGGHYFAYRITSGSKKGYYIYVAEHLTMQPKVGDVITAGQVVAYAQPGYPWTEWGWSASPGTLDLPALQYGNPASCAEATSYLCPGGRAFARFLRELGAKTLDDPGPGSDVPY